MLAFALGSQAQKFEREVKINAAAVPPAAKSFIDSCGLSKVRWVLELSQQGISYEAKATSESKKRFSIEFDTVGNVQDVELLMKWKTVPSGPRLKIENTLQRLFKRHKVIKTQKQWQSDRSTLLNLVREDGIVDIADASYELIVRANDNGKVQLYELLLDAQGDLLRQDIVVSDHADNLEF